MAIKQFTPWHTKKQANALTEEKKQTRDLQGKTKNARNNNEKC